MNTNDSIKMNNNRLGLSILKLGKKLPEWRLEPIFDSHVPKVEDYLGKPTILLFFSFGCPGCLGRAIPYANRLVFEHEDKIQVVGIHTNFEGRDFSVEQFKDGKERFYFRFPFYKDYNYDTSFLNFGAGGTPHWIVLDKEGRVVYSIFGSDPNNALLRLDYIISELLIT